MAIPMGGGAPMGGPPGGMGGAQPEVEQAEVVVCIEKYPDGTYKVGMEPEAAGGMGGPAEESGEKEWMSPVANMNDALQVARDLLSNPQAQEAGEGNRAFEGGFAGTASPERPSMSTKGMR